jgi:NADH-quinone oxidoreductase subunit M
VDGLGLPLVFLTAVLYATAIFTSWTLAQREREFFIWLALLVAGVFGVFTSLDLFLFFMF